MINNPFIFYTISFILVLFAILSLFTKSLIYSLLAAIVVFFSASVIFYILGSEYNAIIQAAIYGLAVPTIIGISIMFTTEPNDNKKTSIIPVILVVTGILFIMAFIYVIMISLAMLPDSFHIMKIQQFNSYEVLSEFARGIFIDYVWAFELLSLLLTVIIAGFTMHNSKKKEGRAK